MAAKFPTPPPTLENEMLKKTKAMKIKLAFAFGDVAVDSVTGFRGKVIGYSKWMTGCDQYFLQPSVKDDDKLPDGKWFDETRLGVASKAKGGPNSNLPSPH